MLSEGRGQFLSHPRFRGKAKDTKIGKMCLASSEQRLFTATVAVASLGHCKSLRTGLALRRGAPSTARRSGLRSSWLAKLTMKDTCPWQLGWNHVLSAAPF